MNTKFMSLAFVVVASGCHAPPEGAVCPAPEEEVAEPESLPDPSKVEMTPELEAAMEKARERTRATRRR